MIINAVLQSGIQQCDIWCNDRGHALYEVCTKYSFI